MTTPAVVVLTDFFAVSNRALSYAAALAVPLQAHLVLLHVRHDGLLSPAAYHHHGYKSERQAQQDLRKLADAQPVPTLVEVSDKFLPDAVTEAVRHHQPQLLVLGRPGTATMPEELVTSAALDLLRHVPYPLLVVPTVGWEVSLPQRLAVAVDGNPFSVGGGLAVVPQLLDKLQAVLSIVHVTSQRDPGVRPAHQALDSVRRSGLAVLPENTRVHIVYHPEAAAGILQGATELQTDLLVVIARRHSLLSSLFHHSVTAQLISESTIPVLLLPSLG